MSYVCVKCGYVTEQYEAEDCPECGGFMEEQEPKIDWEGEEEEREE